jgi:hypothetical protein
MLICAFFGEPHYKNNTSHCFYRINTEVHFLSILTNLQQDPSQQHAFLNLYTKLSTGFVDKQTSFIDSKRLAQKS